jgi:phosphoglycolate phosphatase-like HAD superfamily hydrolase
MIGDSLSDIEFGRCAGMNTIFIVGAPETTSGGAAKADKLADMSCASLQEAVEFILRREL